MKEPSHNISSERATDLLNEGKPLTDLYVEGEIKIETSDVWDKDVVIENCIIESFSGSVTQFKKPVKLLNSRFKNCQFVFTYFLGGLIIENCTFENYSDFQAGGHNQSGSSIIIKNSEFQDFVNFFDSWYEGPVIITDNNFQKGTNLMSKEQLLTFDVPPQISNNQGNLNIESEFAIKE
jgi:hypothetical protein